MLDKTIKNELESERPGVKKKRQDMRKIEEERMIDSTSCTECLLRSTH